jgi:A/G-specific adenine glycosylase
MLQQTQVATVIPYYQRWMNRFPALESLACADEQDVLKLWAGLGYYARARNLLKAVRTIHNDLQGMWPTTAAGLRELPGIGPYTAGAIASIAFNTPEPIVDGNVQRVVARLWAYPPPHPTHLKDHDLRSKKGVKWTWARATDLISGIHTHTPPLDAGDFNSALMELGATICTPRSPKCLLCPVAQACRARQLGLQEQIPTPKRARETPHVQRFAYLLTRPDGSLLLEQRPPSGRWASMWQAPTRDAPPTPRAKLSSTQLGDVHHTLTHRRYTFHVFSAEVPQDFHAPTLCPGTKHLWVQPGKLKDYPVAKPQLQILSQATESSKLETRNKLKVKRRKPQTRPAS